MTTTRSTVDTLAPAGSSALDRHAAHIAARDGLSFDDARLLMLIVEADPKGDGIDASAFDEGGRGTLLWLVHRGFVTLTEGLGVLYVRASSAGLRAVRNGRAALEYERRH